MYRNAPAVTALSKPKPATIPLNTSNSGGLAFGFTKVDDCRAASASSSSFVRTTPPGVSTETLEPDSFHGEVTD
jgi:hypothetical protein